MAGPFKCCAYSFLIIILVAMGGWAFFHFTGVQFLPSEDPNIATPTPTPTVTTDKPLPPDIGIASSLAVPEAAPTGDATNPA